MPNSSCGYVLAPDAVQDLEAIFDYTIDRWGVEQAHRYKNKLSDHFRELGKGTTRSRIFLESMPNLQVSRCERHFVFYLEKEDEPPLILAVLHERMNMVSRIRRRLEDS